MSEIKINQLPNNVQNAIIATMSKNGVEITDDLREDFGNGNLSDLRPIIGDKAVNYYITFYDDMIQEVLDDWNRTFAEQDREVLKDATEDEIFAQAAARHANDPKYSEKEKERAFGNLLKTAFKR